VIVCHFDEELIGNIHIKARKVLAYAELHLRLKSDHGETYRLIGWSVNRDNMWNELVIVDHFKSTSQCVNESEARPYHMLVVILYVALVRCLMEYPPKSFLTKSS
jgi:hypothetical protein